MNSNKRSTQNRSLNLQEAKFLANFMSKEPVMKKQGKRKRKNLKRGNQRDGAAVSYATGQISLSPNISNKSKGCRVTHRELIWSGTGSVGFVVSQTFPLNPGMGQSFPWLSRIASNWEKYRFNKLRFCYYTRCSTATAGSVMLIPDYDASDAPPITELVASTYQDVVEDAPWKNICCSLNKKQMHDTLDFKFVRTAALGPNLDIKTYDVGNLFFATTDGAVVPWGKVWVEYDVEFENPQLNPEGDNIYGGQILSSISTTPANPLGTLPVVRAFSNGIEVNATSNIQFDNPGTYLVGVDVNGTGLTGLACVGRGGIPPTSTALNFTIDSAGLGITETFAVVCTTFNQIVSITATGTTVTSCAVQVGMAPGGSMP